MENKISIYSGGYIDYGLNNKVTGNTLKEEEEILYPAGINFNSRAQQITNDDDDALYPPEVYRNLQKYEREDHGLMLAENLAQRYGSSAYIVEIFPDKKKLSYYVDNGVSAVQRFEANYGVSPDQLNVYIQWETARPISISSEEREPTDYKAQWNKVVEDDDIAMYPTGAIVK